MVKLQFLKALRIEIVLGGHQKRNLVMENSVQIPQTFM